MGSVFLLELGMLELMDLRRYYQLQSYFSLHHVPLVKYSIVHLCLNLVDWLVFHGEGVFVPQLNHHQRYCPSRYLVTDRFLLDVLN